MKTLRAGLGERGEGDGDRAAGRLRADRGVRGAEGRAGGGSSYYLLVASYWLRSPGWAR